MDRRIFFLACLIGLSLVSPVQAKRELAAGALPQAVLEAFFSDLSTAVENPANAELGLNATYNLVDGYWIRTTREQVQQTGQVADLNSVMFFKFNRPSSWVITSLRSAGEFARAEVRFQPSASAGVVRNKEHDTIDTTFNLVLKNDDWFIVDFKGPEVKPSEALPEALIVDPSDTPATLVSRFMDIVLQELGPASGSPGSNVNKVAAATKNMWVDERDSRRSLGQGLTMMSMLQPTSWHLVELDQQRNTAELTITIESGSPVAALVPGANKDGGPTTIRFLAKTTNGQWLLQAFIR